MNFNVEKALKDTSKSEMHRDRYEMIKTKRYRSLTTTSSRDRDVKLENLATSTDGVIMEDGGITLTDYSETETINKKT